MRFEWDIDGQVVSADLSLTTGRETVAVDGVLVFDRISWKLRNEIPIDLDSGRPAKVVVSSRHLVFPHAQLVVSGFEIEPRNENQGRSKGIPWWSWPFVIACLIVPIATLGGAIPAVAGLFGAGLNRLVAGREWGAFPRIVLMTMITAFVWIFVASVVLGVGLIVPS